MDYRKMWKMRTFRFKLILWVKNLLGTFLTSLRKKVIKAGIAYIYLHSKLYT